MRISVEKQTPAMALTAMIVIIVLSSVRHALSPFGNELAGARVVPMVAEYLSAAERAWPITCIAVSALLLTAAGVVVGRIVGRFRLYPVQTFLTMPLFGFVSCGIFISGDMLAASLTSLLGALALNYVCRGYLRERDLSAMLYAGLCIGTMMLISTSGAVYVAAALLAVFILSFSTRELFILLTAIALPVGVNCYAEWALGGDFLTPVLRFRDALLADSGVSSFGDDAVCALVLCGLLGFALVSSTMLFLANRFMVSLKSRGILIYNVVLWLLSVAMFALPSSTPADFAVAAVPMSVIMPVVFIRERERLSAILYLSLWAVFMLHLMYL